MRGTDVRVDVDLASLPGPRGFLNGPWMQVHGGCITGADVAARPYNDGILCKFDAFLGTLHLPVDAVDMGHFWGFFLKKFSSFSSNGLATGCSVKSSPGLMLGPTVIPSVPVLEGIENWTWVSFR